MLNQFSRTELLLGKSAVLRLSESRVAVFGIGGVGSYTAEALARSGIGQLDLIDNDTVSLTNINRQLIALHSTIGRSKVDVMKERILDINPQCIVRVFRCFYLPETKDLFDFTRYDYVIDAVDTVSAKIQLIMQAKEAGVPVISCMGAGNKLDPARFEIADIARTSVCPLARVIRQECKKRGISGVKVVYSKEPPVRRNAGADAGDGAQAGSVERKGNGIAPGSCAFVPPVAGLIIAGEVVKDLVELRYFKET